MPCFFTTDMAVLPLTVILTGLAINDGTWALTSGNTHMHAITIEICEDSMSLM